MKPACRTTVLPHLCLSLGHRRFSQAGPGLFQTMSPAALNPRLTTSKRASPVCADKRLDSLADLSAPMAPTAAIGNAFAKLKLCGTLARQTLSCLGLGAALSSLTRPDVLVARRSASRKHALCFSCMYRCPCVTCRSDLDSVTDPFDVVRGAAVARVYSHGSVLLFLQPRAPQHLVRPTASQSPRPLHPLSPMAR